jgi:hypothetical protein
MNYLDELKAQAENEINIKIDYWASQWDRGDSLQREAMSRALRDRISGYAGSSPYSAPAGASSAPAVRVPAFTFLTMIK